MRGEAEGGCAGARGFGEGSLNGEIAEWCSHCQRI